MSYTSLYELFKTKVNCITELRNGHGSGPAIWDYVGCKVHGKRFDMLNSEYFWHSYKSPKLDEDEKLVLLATYDNSFVETEYLAEFSVSCRKLHKLIIETTDWTWSHFDAIGEAAEKLHKDHDSRCRGMAIGCASVGDIWEEEDVRNIDAWGVYGHLMAGYPSLRSVEVASRPTPRQSE